MDTPNGYTDAPQKEGVMSAVDCEICPHAWDCHNGMGDCTHLDGRTATGYCAAHQGE